MKENGRGHELTGKEVGKTMAKESGSKLEKGGETVVLNNALK